MFPSHSKRFLVPAVALCLVLSISSAEAQKTRVKPGFNIFNEKQDVEIGAQSAQEVEKQLPVLNDSAVQAYISHIGERLVPAAPGPKFPYQFKVVNVSDVNAFALPGGFMYIHRGLIEAAHDEGELAGVMAHEMSHVALRHGTNQVSKAYLAQAGLGILGGAAGKGTGAIIGAMGGFGLNSLFLKFSRTAEEQADVVGAQMLAESGYDPMAMARMFETLREKAGHDPGKLEQFFSSHPAPADRAKRIQRETDLIGGYDPARPVGDFRSIQARLQRMPPAPSMEQLAGGKTGGSTGGTTERTTPGSGTPVRVDIERPSTRMQIFQSKSAIFSIRHPDNWEAHEPRNEDGVTLLPRNGVVAVGNNQQAIVCGVVVSAFEPRRSAGRKGISIDEATNQLVNKVVDDNRYLRPVSGSQRRDSIDDSMARSLTLSGQSPVTGELEEVRVVTTWLSDGRLLYALFISPQRGTQQLASTFDQMISSIRIEPSR